MAVTVSLYNHTAKLLANKEVTFSTLSLKLLSSSASFTASHTSEEQVDNGATATVTMAVASPGKVTHTAHGKSAGTPVAFLTSGALLTGITAATFYYVNNPGTNDYELSATSGGSSINFSGAQSGAHTAYYGGSYEVKGNAWPGGGPTLASVAVTTVTTNDAMLDADDVRVTASGGSIGPSTAALLYDRTTMKPLAYIDFGASQTAGDATDFLVAWNSGGLISFTY